MDNVLVLHEYRDAIWQTQFAGIGRFARGEGWRVQEVLVLAGGPPLRLAELLELWHPVGIISSLSQRIKIPDGVRCAVVYFDCPREYVPKGSPYLRHNAETTARLAAVELLSLGLTAFAYVGYPGHQYWSEERGNLFSEVLALHGMQALRFTSRAPVFDSVVLQRELRRWVRGLPKPCGVFAANDALAVQVLSACAAEKRSVPEEIAVVGVDNDVEACENTQPTLTSVIPDWEQGGYMAASLLDDILHGRRDGIDSETFMPLGVMRRASTRHAWVRSDPRILAAVELIRREACAGLTAAAVIRSTGLTRRVAEMRFREMTGTSILAEIRRVRFENARFLLRQKIFSEAAIANRCGYQSVPTFSAAFKKETGLTFRAWRKRELSL